MWLAILLCMGVLFVWQTWVSPPPQQAPQQANQAQQVQQLAPAKTPQASNPNPGQPPLQAPSVTPQTRSPLAVKTFFSDAAKNQNEIQISNEPKFLQNWNIDEYSLNLTSISRQEGQISIAFDDPSLKYFATAQGVLDSQTGVWTYEDANLKVTRALVATQNPNVADLRIEGKFKTVQPKFIFITLSARGSEDDPEMRDRGFVFLNDGSLERALAYDTTSTVSGSGYSPWIGITDRYFLFALLAPQASGLQAKGLIQGTAIQKGADVNGSLYFPVSGPSLSLPLKLYFGAKELDRLRAVEPTLDLTVDFGMFTFVAYPLLRIMKWFHGIFHNWGVAIILLTLLVKILTFPLTYKSMKSMKKMAKLQPRIKLIQEKYKDDREALNREMMTMMKTHGYNPMAGCFPILIQMPVFFALYQVLYSSFELYKAPFMLWITDLSLKDPFYVTPVILTAVMYLQQKLTPATISDPMQAKMMQFMPIIFGVMMVTLPSGLTLYMLVNAAASIAQQLYFNKKFKDE